MVKQVLDIAGKLIPPSDPEAVWRWWMSAGLIATMAMTATHIAWACGWLPGISGFALAGEVQEAAADRARIEHKLHDIERQQQAGLQILLAQEICRIYRIREDAEGTVAQALTASLEEKQQAYRALTGARYPLMECAP